MVGAKVWKIRMSPKVAKPSRQVPLTLVASDYLQKVKEAGETLDDHIAGQIGEKIQKMWNKMGIKDRDSVNANWGSMHHFEDDSFYDD